MSDAIGEVLSFAVAAGLSPIPIVGVVLMLGSPRGRVNGLAFVVGWVGLLAPIVWASWLTVISVLWLVREGVGLTLARKAAA